jgi:hypothetical protein
VAVAHLGVGQGEDQQGDRDGEDAVAERRDPVEGRRGRAFGIVLLAHPPLLVQPSIS